MRVRPDDFAPSERRGAETAVCRCGGLISRRWPDEGGRAWAWLHDAPDADHAADPVGVAR